VPTAPPSGTDRHESRGRCSYDGVLPQIRTRHHGTTKHTGCSRTHTHEHRSLWREALDNQLGTVLGRQEGRAGGWVRRRRRHSTKKAVWELPPACAKAPKKRQRWGAAVWRAQTQVLLGRLKYALPGWEEAESRRAADTATPEASWRSYASGSGGGGGLGGDSSWGAGHGGDVGRVDRQ
jgi:hypothetical protein